MLQQVADLTAAPGAVRALSVGVPTEATGMKLQPEVVAPWQQARKTLPSKPLQVMLQLKQAKARLCRLRIVWTGARFADRCVLTRSDH